MRNGSKPCRLRPGGQHVGRAKEIATRRGAQKPAIQRVQNRLELPILGAVARLDRSKSRSRASVAGWGSMPAMASEASTSLPSTKACTAAREHLGACSEAAAARIRDGHQQIDALRRRCRLPHDMQPIGNEGVLELQDLSAGAPRFARPHPHPSPAAAAPNSSCAACAWISSASESACPAPGLEARQPSIDSFRSTKPAVQAGIGERRGKVADEGRAGTAFGDRSFGRIVRGV